LGTPAISRGFSESVGVVKAYFESSPWSFVNLFLLLIIKKAKISTNKIKNTKAPTIPTISPTKELLLGLAEDDPLWHPFEGQGLVDRPDYFELVDTHYCNLLFRFFFDLEPVHFVKNDHQSF